jgi:GAF domain-containing protein
MIAPDKANAIIQDLDVAPEQGVAFRRKAMQALSQLPGYDWSGVYRLDGDGLVLDEFVGEPTDHTQIPVGLGVCGTAVKEHRNQIVKDVRDLDNYLSCSVDTRSEIVVLIRQGTEVLGQIDIDGHQVGSFDVSDEHFLVRIADLIAERW